MFKLRPYQEKAHSQIVELFKQQKKALLVMATGAGKSKTVVSFVKKYNQHYVFIIAVRTRDLVNQLAEDLDFFGLEYGVFMAGHEKYSPKKEIQLCSIDTIHSRAVYPHRWKNKDVVLVIDEADQSKAEGYQQLIHAYCHRDDVKKPAHLDHTKPFRNAFLLGMTATPYNGLSHFDDYIEPITPIQLNKDGVLVDYKYYVPKSAIDLSDVGIVKGEYVAKQIEAKLNSATMIKRCFESWLEFGDNRQTLVFCVNQDHAKTFCKYINDYYAKPVAMFVDSNTKEEDRKIIYNQFRNGTLKFLLNVRLITRGVNIIEIGTILDCATTLSANLHIQKLGRGSRANPHYSDCILIDCASNLINNGHFYQKREIDLKEEKKRTKKDLEDIQMRVCFSCFRAAEVKDFGLKNTCPYCSAKNKPLPKKKISKAEKHKLFMENATPEEIEQQQMIKDFKKILWLIENPYGKKSQLSRPIIRQKALFKMLDKYGVDKCKKIKKSIGLEYDIIKTWKELNSYIPLGGLDL